MFKDMTFLFNKHVCVVDKESCTTTTLKNGPFGWAVLMSECTAAAEEYVCLLSK